MNKPLEDMTEPEISALMVSVAKAVKRTLPPKSLFTVLVWNDPKVAQYISNCNREDMVKALREAADRLANRQDVSNG